MAPPQVDVAKKQSEKQPLEDVQNWAQMVGDMKLPPLSPINNVSVKSKKGGKCRRHFKPLLIGFISGVVVAAIIAGIAIAAHRARRHHKDKWDCDVDHHRGDHHRRGHHDDSGEDSHEDFGDHDDAKEHMMADGSKVFIARNGTRHHFQMYAILDFEAHMAGFKDVDSQRCFVDKLPEDVEEGREKWRRCKHDKRRPGDRPVRVVTPAMHEDVLRYVAGEDIAKLCQGLQTFWVVPIPPELSSITDEIMYL